MRTSVFCLAVAALASTGCEYFSTTTVPASDTQLPFAAVALYFDGDHEELRFGRRSVAESFNTEEFNYVTSDPLKPYFAITAGVDGGGVREVRMWSRVYYRCLWGDVSVKIIEPWTSQTVQQEGSIGSTVDNGLYTWRPFVARNYFSSLERCDGGGFRITMQWYGSAEDFHGNYTYFGAGKVTFVDWDG